MLTSSTLLLGALLCIHASASPLPRPSQSRCSTNSTLGALPFCNASLPTDGRVADLVGRLTTAEKISLMGQGPTSGGKSQGVARLGVAPLPWGEALHGVVSHCYNGTYCPTSFPHALALAAAFNRTLWHAVGDRISTEARALNNLGTLDYIGCGPDAPLMVWAPNLNPYRDPRWGRGHETPGEDPYLGGEYGVALITGIQGDLYSQNASGSYMKAVAIVKHSFDYDIEGNHGPADRQAFNAVVSAVDQNNYFLPPFKAVITRARAGGLMCSYNGINGVPSCMNGDLNNGVVRDQWGLDDGIIVSDCDAVGDTFATAFIKDKFGGSPEAQVQQGVRGGCDFDCGKTYGAHLPSALKAGMVNDTDINTAVSRLLKKAFQLGFFDHANAVPYAAYGVEKLATADSAALALAGATQSIVLLKNEGAGAGSPPLLPLAAGAKVALIGPHLNATTDMLSNYRGDNNLVYQHSPLLAMAQRGNVIGHAQGSALSDPDESGFAEAVALAQKADVAVVFLGLHPQWFDTVPQNDVNEGEERDRVNITLSDVQIKLLQAVATAGTPVALVLINGGQLAVPWAKSSKEVCAIVEAFYPGQMGGDALASVLYGDVSPSGRLPYTMYDSDFTERRPNIGDMSLSTGGGLTYQYYDGTPLWPFGFGLSYTTFALKWGQSAAEQTTTRRALASTSFSVTATNTGSSVTSDVTILAFLTAVREEGAPLKQPGHGQQPPQAPQVGQPQRELFAFCRLQAVAPLQSATCDLPVAESVVAHNATVFAGAYTVVVELGDGTGIQGRLTIVDQNQNL